MKMTQRRKRSIRCRGCGLLFGRLVQHDWGTCEAMANELRARRRGLQRTGVMLGEILDKAGLTHTYRSGVPGQRSRPPLRERWAQPWALDLADHLLKHVEPDVRWPKTVMVAVLMECKKDPSYRDRQLAMLTLSGQTAATVEPSGAP